MTEFSVRDRSEFGEEVCRLQHVGLQCAGFPICRSDPPDSTKNRTVNLSKILDKLKIMDYNIS